MPRFTGIFSSATFSASENGPQNSSRTLWYCVFARLDLVEFFLHVARELQVHHLREMLDQQVGHRSCRSPWRRSGVPSPRCSRAPRRDLVDDLRIGAGPADAFLFQRLDQRRLVVARRRLGEVLAGRSVQTVERLLLGIAGSVASSSLLCGASTLRKPSNFRILPCALNNTPSRPASLVRRQHLDVGHGEDRRRHLAGDEAVDRSACTAAADRRAGRAGRRAPACYARSVGRIASWASWRSCPTRR